MPIFSPRTTLRLVDSLATTFAQAYQLARTRLASAASPVLRLLMQRDHAVTDLELERRESAMLRGSRENVAPHRRPEYTPAQRLEILQIKRLRGWDLATTARHFAVHENTVRSWQQALDGKGRASLLTGAIVWNQIDDAVRWTVHELRRVCPEIEFGTRSLAREILKAAVQISRSSVQRILREDAPEKPKQHAAVRVRKPEMELPAGVKPHHLLTPKRINYVWHLDLTCIRVLWITLTVAGILDGFSRKLLALRVYRHRPDSQDMVNLVRRTIRQYGQPRFLITDHGCQFRDRFQTTVEERLRIHHVRSRVRTPYLDGKLERAFRTFKFWWRHVLTGCTVRSVQRRLDAYRHWYNTSRIHSALGMLTPQEAWDGVVPPEPIPIRAADGHRVSIQVTRTKCRGDPRLRVLQISVCRQAA